VGSQYIRIKRGRTLGLKEPTPWARDVGGLKTKGCGMIQVKEYSSQKVPGGRKVQSYGGGKTPGWGSRNGMALHGQQANRAERRDVRGERQKNGSVNLPTPRKKKKGTTDRHPSTNNASGAGKVGPHRHYRGEKRKLLERGS